MKFQQSKTRTRNANSCYGISKVVTLFLVCLEPTFSFVHMGLTTTCINFLYTSQACSPSFIERATFYLFNAFSAACCWDPRRLTNLSRASFIHIYWQASFASCTLIYTQKCVPHKHQQLFYFLVFKRQFNDASFRQSHRLSKELSVHTHFLWRTSFSGQKSNCSSTSKGNMYPS